MTDPLAHLNPTQKEAVSTLEGPLLILAGAGSGKTRVITHRIAHLVRSGAARPEEIVAVTFTNKAAGEMKERAAELLGDALAGAWVGTFHALCLRILRREGALLGYAPGFVVYDTADQLALVRACMKELGREDAAESARAMLHRISAAKNRLQTPAQARAGEGGPIAEAFAACYEAYQAALKKNNAADFDDLIMQVLLLLETYPGVGERYAAGCRQLMVDEYQDTNHAQYRLIRALARAHRNVCCVGDEDQSIFSWRGADIRNILDFRTDYPDARVVKLEQNYRSTRTILAAATAVIANNRDRIGKTLWTDNGAGEPVELRFAEDDRSEAEQVLGLVRALNRSGRRFEEIAVLYRTNNQSRLFEEVFLREHLPHRVVGSLRFYERREIKDLVAWLRVLVNPADDMSLARILNVPPRGIGKGTLDALAEIARRESLPLGGALRRAIEARELPARATKALADFAELLDSLRRLAGGAGLIEAGGDGASPPAGAEPAPAGVTGLLRAIAERIGYAEHLEKAFPGDHEARLMNIDALTSAAAEYDEEGAPDGLQGFVDRSSLRSDTDDVQGDAGVTLLTAHSAKGLEFPVVFVTGLEENVFPHIRSSESRAELEEERRLFYVAMTRARERLYLTAAGARRSFGDFVENPPSRFLAEVPEELVSGPLPAALAAGALEAWSGGGGTAAWSGRRAARGAGSPRARRPAGQRAGRRVGNIHYDPAGYEEDGYAVGMKVTHPMFGRGTIAAVEGSGSSLKLTIRFTQGGVRKILPRHTTLTIGR